MPERHEVETFLDDRTFRWGWQCFTCTEEMAGFLAMVTAETSGNQHRMGPRDTDSGEGGDATRENR